MKLPFFKYHPNPLKTNSIEKSLNICEVCNVQKGYIITSTIYSKDNISNICPWCVANGNAAKKFNGSFVANIDEYEHLTKSIIDEILLRTVSFCTYQEEIWLTHCNDGCEFHGQAKIKDLKKISEEEIIRLEESSSLTRKDINELLKLDSEEELYYLFKFKCRHCDEIRFLEDLD